MKKRWKKTLVCTVLLTLVITIVVPTTNADGWHPSQEYLHLYEPFQKAVIHWDGVTQTMFLSSAVKSTNLTNIAWVVPILSTTKPEVSAANMSIFEELVDYFKEPLYWQGSHLVLDTSNRKEHSNVTVVESKEIEIYDVVILKATDASDLIEWLTDHEFMVPEDAYEIIREYVQTNNCYFVVNKIDLENRFKDVIEQLENGSTTVDASEYYEVLQSLQQGMATPLKYEFTPPTPYYPLTISSLNTGYGVIDVYVIAEKPVNDDNNVLTIDKCKIIDPAFRKQLSEYISVDKADFVTRLTYRGQLENLHEDAEFSLYPLSMYGWPSLSFVPTRLSNLSGVEKISIETSELLDEIIELQYRIDDDESWKVAEEVPLRAVFTNTKKITVHPVTRLQHRWTIVLNMSRLTGREHVLHIRALQNDGSSIEYKELSSFPFTIQDSTDAALIQEQNLVPIVFIVGIIMVLSMMAGIALSDKKQGQ